MLYTIHCSSVVVFRKANKMGFFIKVIPLLPDEEVKVRGQGQEQ